MKSNNQDIHETIYNSTVIRYVIIRKKVKNINLRIKPDGMVTVSASSWIAGKTIENFILLKGEWILKALEKYTALQNASAKPKEYINGETVQFLGKKYILIVTESKKDAVVYDESSIYLYTKKADSLIQKKKLWDNWQKKQCSTLFNQISKEIYPIFETYNLPYPTIKIRLMKTRWGSCQPAKNVITFNQKLIEAPIECIEYVVLHEFSHLIHPNHSKRFYGFIENTMPNWKERKTILGNYA